MTAMVLHSASLSGLVPQKTTSTYSKELQNSVNLRTKPWVRSEIRKEIISDQMFTNKKTAESGEKIYSYAEGTYIVRGLIVVQ